MKKKLLSIFLSLAMVFTLMPMIESAATAAVNDEFSLDGGNTKYKVTSEGTSNEVTLSYVAGSVTELIVPATVEYNTKTYSVTSIADDVCYNKNTLQRVVLPDTVTLIGDSAFLDCDALTEIILPDSLTTIKRKAIAQNTNLTRLTIPASVTTIGNQAFDQPGIKEITFKGLVPPSMVLSGGDSIFNNCTTLETIYVPKEARAAYEAAMPGYVSKIKNESSITITKTSGGGPAALNVDYTYDQTNKTYTILSGNLTVSGYTQCDSFVIDSGYSSQLTLKNLTVDLSGTNKTAIESLAGYATIDIKGTNSITAGTIGGTTGTDYEQMAAGIKGKSITLTGDGSLYIYAGQGSYKHAAIYVTDGFMSRVSFLYLNGYRGISSGLVYNSGDTVSPYVNIAVGNVYIFAECNGIEANSYLTSVTIGEGVNPAMVNIYSAFMGLTANSLTVNNNAKLIVQTEGSNGCGYGIYNGGTLTLGDSASLYVTHCDSQERALYCGGSIVLPGGKSIKAAKKAPASSDECTAIDLADLYNSSEEAYDTGWEYNTLVFGEPTLLQSEIIDFKTKVQAEGSVEISGLTVPGVPENLPGGRWYYAANLECYDSSSELSLSCMDPVNCISGSSNECMFHRMAHIAEGYASLMPNLIPLEVSGGTAVISGLTSPYVAIVYASEDSVKRAEYGAAGTGDVINLAYGIGLAEISDWTAGTENNSANILVPDVYGKVGDIFPLSWCGEWELDNIYIEYEDYINDENSFRNTYYIGSEYNGITRTKGDLVLNLNSDRSYTLTGLENASDISKCISEPDIGGGYAIKIGGKNYLFNYNNYSGYEQFTLSRSINKAGILYDNVSYNFVRSDIDRVNINYGDGVISLIKGDYLETGDLPVSEKAGFVFGGWFTDSDCLILAPGELGPEEDITVYPKWFNVSKDTYITSISGILKTNGVPAESAEIDLFNGSTYIGYCYTNADGSFTMELPHAIAPGFYQLAVCPNDINGYTAYLAEITSGSAGTINIELNEGVQGYISKNDDILFYPLGIGNFELLTAGESPTGTNIILVQAYYGSSYIEDVAEADMKSITGETDYFDYFDVQISKTELDEYEEYVSGGILYDTAPVVMALALAYPTKTRKDIQVLRYHDGDGDMIINGTVSAFTKLSQRPVSDYQDGTYYVGDNYILIYSSKFSSFGIASNAGTSTQEDPTPDPLIHNGGYSHIETAAERHARLVETAKAQLSKTEIKAKSKNTKLNGKKAVKLTWRVTKGDYALLDFDGFDIFRSEKRYSGYGNTPYFTTTKTSYINNKDLKKGKTYYYKVRAYKIIDGEKVYTGWSTKAWRTVK